jgi:hypothetical protein
VLQQEAGCCRRLGSSVGMMTGSKQ